MWKVMLAIGIGVLVILAVVVAVVVNAAREHNRRGAGSSMGEDEIYG